MKITTPQDGWGALKPRRWQQEVLPVLCRHYTEDKPLRGVVHAVMGSGKAKTLSQFVACCRLERDEVVVVSTSSIRLVEQLSKDLRERLESDEFMAPQIVGAFYTHGKDLHTKVIVTCMPSMPDLAAALRQHGQRCALWVADECHRAQSKAILDAYDVLLPDRVLGFSATPFRAKKTESLTLFDKVLYSYGPKQALEDKDVVVPWKIVPWEGDPGADLDTACIQMTKEAVGPGIFNARSINDAEVFKQRLMDSGFAADCIHSKIVGGDVTTIMRKLQSGELRAVVHCNMFVEGVDYPWLRWMCLRRPVTSRVRFAQEIGRSLRWYKNIKTGEVKTEAVLYDPHGLFDVFRLNYEAVLGGEYEDTDDPDEPESKKAERVLQQSVFDCMKHLVAVDAGKMPLAVEPMASYLREVVNAFDVCELLNRKLETHRWRNEAPSAKQLSAISNMTWIPNRYSCVPKIHKQALLKLTGVGTKFNRGMASDLLSVFMSIAERKTWPDFKRLDASAVENIAKVEAKKITPAKPKEQQLGNAEIQSKSLVQGTLFSDQSGF